MGGAAFAGRLADPAPGAHRRVARADAHQAPEADSGFYEDGTPCWAETQTATLEPESPSEPLREVLAGLAVREVREPDVFQHFFGGR